jgi:nicotinate-nucleotide adenylyltransferase
LVSPQNPLKSEADMATLAERLAGARALSRDRRVVATAIETELGTRFTADTLAALHASFPRTRFVWLMGADNMGQIPRWQRWPDIFRRTPVAVFARHPYSLRSLASKAAERFRPARIGGTGARRLGRASPPAWAFLAIPLHPASATEIRRRRARVTDAMSAARI